MDGQADEVMDRQLDGQIDIFDPKQQKNYEPNDIFITSSIFSITFIMTNMIKNILWPHNFH